MSDDGDIIPSVMQNGGSQYKIKENSFLSSTVGDNIPNMRWARPSFTCFTKIY